MTFRALAQPDELCPSYFSRLTVLVQIAPRPSSWIALIPTPCASGRPTDSLEVDVISESGVRPDRLDHGLLTHFGEVVTREAEVSCNPLCVVCVDSRLSGEHAAQVGVVNPA